MDAFYVSVERRGNPDLVGKPVIVGADPKGGKGRGVAMAASYEARQLGVSSGMPISMAWRKLPQASYLRPNYDLYMAASESVIEVLRSFADVLEHVRIDEAFLDVTSKVPGLDGGRGSAAPALGDRSGGRRAPGRGTARSEVDQRRADVRQGRHGLGKGGIDDPRRGPKCVLAGARPGRDLSDRRDQDPIRRIPDTLARADSRLPHP